VLPHPQQLAALGAVLCLYRAHSGGGLVGWTQAVRATRDCALDSDGLRESMHFFDAGGRCCWQLHLLPDTDFLAWDLLAAGLPCGCELDAGSSLAERLWRRVASRFGDPDWQANVVRFHALPAGPGFAGMSLLAASLPRLSPCGGEMARRIIRHAGVECDGLLDDCCCRQAATPSTVPDARACDLSWRYAFNTRTYA